jgi:tRNA threonylcarbamoyl adenosine modification protein YeaZ
MILAIDTSAAQCAVALLDGEAVSMRAPMERGHAEALFPMIDAVLARAGAAYADLARIAVCTGPGSFTGLRVGVAAARGLALALGVPAIGVSRFEALAAEAGGPVAVCLAGGGSSVYLQLFEADGRQAGAPRLLGAGALAAAIPAGIRRFAGDGAPRIAGEAGLLPEGLPDPEVIARIAAARAPGEPPRPLYLRGADAAPPREAPPPLLD